MLCEWAWPGAQVEWGGGCAEGVGLGLGLGLAGRVGAEARAPAEKMGLSAIAGA